MNDDIWLSVLSRITPSEPVDLDYILEETRADHQTSDWACELQAPHAPMSAKLWERDTSRSYIGIRVLQPPTDCVGLALRLAAIAVERNVIPILFTPLDQTGFERFGFRVERLPDATPDVQMDFEMELRRFWDMAIVLDLADVGMLG